MNSPTTSPETPGSISLPSVPPAIGSGRPVTPPAPPLPSKVTVLAKTAPLTAVRLATDRTVELPDGRTLQALAGDWLITRGRIIIDVSGPAQLDERYQIVDGNDRILSAALRTRLEQTLGLGTTRNSDDLIAAVERLASISIGTVKIEFTPGQLEEIKYRATKRGQSIEQTLQAVVDRIKEEIFWRS